MPNPLLDFVEKHAGADFLPRLKQHVVGFAEDFWKDGTEISFRQFVKPLVEKTSVIKKTPVKSSTATPKPGAPPQLWHAEPGEISEKMWGNGFLTPGDEIITETLIKLLGLNKDMNVLDLSAGLGGRLRRTTEKYGVYITGLEPDPQIAARGMEMSVRAGKSKHATIAAYDPANFSSSMKYDCIIARETFYRVADKNKFFTELSRCAKPKAQISFTDYILNPEDRDKPAIAAWMAFEKGAVPLSLVEMAEAWAKVGFTIRVHEDQTGLYRKEVIAGLKRFAVFLATGGKPDAETKKSILKRIQTWVHRMAALEQGMKFYRFYGTRE